MFSHSYPNVMINLTKKQHGQQKTNINIIYFVSFLILCFCLLIMYTTDNLLILSILGHVSMIVSLIYGGFNKKMTYLFIGHSLLVMNSLIRLEKKYKKSIVPSIMGTIAHTLFAANFLRLLLLSNDRFNNLQQILFTLSTLANIGLAILYYVSFADANCSVSNDYKNLIKIIGFLSTGIISIFFFHKLLTEQNTKMYAHIIMFTYYSLSFLKIFNS